MATPASLRRIARLAHKLERELKTGGLAYPWKSLFRTNAILTRLVAHLAAHLADEAAAKQNSGAAALPRRTRVTLPIEQES